MSLSWTYITRRFLFQNYRDTFSMLIIGTFVMGKFMEHNSKKSDNNWALVLI